MIFWHSSLRQFTKQDYIITYHQVTAILCYIVARVSTIMFKSFIACTCIYIKGFITFCTQCIPHWYYIVNLYYTQVNK